MNMAEANGALLAAGDVSILNFLPFENTFWIMGNSTNPNIL